jgi:hypothetical protein
MKFIDFIVHKILGADSHPGPPDLDQLQPHRESRKQNNVRSVSVNPNLYGGHLDDSCEMLTKDVVVDGKDGADGDGGKAAEVTACPSSSLEMEDVEVDEPIVPTTPRNGEHKHHHHKSRERENSISLAGEEEEEEATTIGDKRLVRMGLSTALAIGIHNFPEGLATFVGALDDPSGACFPHQTTSHITQLNEPNLMYHITYLRLPCPLFSSPYSLVAFPQLAPRWPSPSPSTTSRRGCASPCPSTTPPATAAR